MNTSSQYTAIPLEQPAQTTASRKTHTIGLPRCNDKAEKRFPITPEGVAMLTERGFTIKMESQAGAPIHYTDEQYSRAGAHIVNRSETLLCDIVIHLAPLSSSDIAGMRRGALLLTLLPPNRIKPDNIKSLLSRHITTIGIDMLHDNAGHKPFADILAEIDGLAAISRASSLLADAVHGKGILLGGIAGIVPCEITIIGSNIAGCATARSALGAGAVVRMFDHDVYSLRTATRELGPGVIGSSMHPRTVESALRTADVVVYAGTNPAPSFGSDITGSMKRGVIVFDLTDDCGHAFPSLPVIDLAMASPIDISPVAATRVCYVNAGSSVPRTAAMALTNTFITLLGQISACEGTVNALKLLPGLRDATVTFMGKTVHRIVAETIGERYVDINLYLTLS